MLLLQWLMIKSMEVKGMARKQTPIGIEPRQLEMFCFVLKYFYFFLVEMCIMSTLMCSNILHTHAKRK